MRLHSCLHLSRCDRSKLGCNLPKGQCRGNTNTRPEWSAKALSGPRSLAAKADNCGQSTSGSDQPAPRPVHIGRKGTSATVAAAIPGRCLRKSPSAHRARTPISHFTRPGPSRDDLRVKQPVRPETGQHFPAPQISLHDPCSHLISRLRPIRPARYFIFGSGPLSSLPGLRDSIIVLPHAPAAPASLRCRIGKREARVSASGGMI